MFKWNEETIKYYIRQDEYDKYSLKLSKILRPYLLKSKNIADIGCGLCLLSQHLSKYKLNIDCFDTSKTVLKKVDLLLKEKNITNINLYNKDIFKILKTNNKKYDTLIFSHFGNIEEIFYISKILLNENGQAIVIKKNCYDGHFKKQYVTALHFLNYLTKNKIEYTNIFFPFTQHEPLIDIKDMNKFFKIYKKPKNNIKKTYDFFTENKEKVKFNFIYSFNRDTKIIILKNKNLKIK